MDVPVHALRYFRALADHLHFGRAARSLGISTPSLSAQIIRLEATLDARLFDRTPQSVRLTEEGAELLPLAVAALRANDDVVAWAATRGRITRRGRLRVGIVASGAPATAILEAAVHRLPQVELEVRRLGFFEETAELADGRVDVAFAPAPVGRHPAIRSRVLWTEPRVLVVSARHRLADRDAIDIAESRDELFLAAAGGDAEAIDWWLVDPRPDGSRPRRGPVARDLDALLEMCAAGVGVNIASASAATHYRRDDLAVIPIRDIPPAQMLLCVPARSSNPLVAVFEQIASEIAEAHAGSQPGPTRRGPDR